MASPTTSVPSRARQHVGSLLAHVLDRALDDAPERLAPLLLADVVLDEEDGDAAGILASTEAGQFVVEHLHVLGAGRHFQLRDETFLKFHCCSPRGGTSPDRKARYAAPNVAKVIRGRREQ